MYAKQGRKKPIKKITMMTLLHQKNLGNLRLMYLLQQVNKTKMEERLRKN